MRVNMRWVCARWVMLGLISLPIAVPINAAWAMADDGPQEGVAAMLTDAFTYQGRLEDNGAPAQGLYDMRFTLYSDSGIQISSRFSVSDVGVVDGLFSVELEFGSQAWDTNRALEKYLQIEVRPAGAATYTVLSPRVKLASAPHADVARRLIFPYTEFVGLLDPSQAAMALTVPAGTALRLETAAGNPAPALLITTGGVLPGFVASTVLVSNTTLSAGIIGHGQVYGVAGYIDRPEGSAALRGDVGPGAGSGASAIVGTNASFGTSAKIATNTHGAEFAGNVSIEGGTISRAFGAFSATQSPASPIGYGFINASGTISRATSNMTSSWNAALKRYEIHLNDFAISYGMQTAVVTVEESSEPLVATTGTTGGNLFVKVWDINSGNVAVQAPIQVVIYKSDISGLEPRRPGEPDESAPLSAER